ncbi:hypothetical protein HJC23_004203 [Cyclotella cryptica]|uniref:Uncharacterized protein n=1 Tax=Cyclotella cryptica TaxID=29204 RepID=A0ABD3Q8Z3_9STRA|eukprot:CCRYP_007836-RA/>CCRYP_007836-RA protein AED:0.13 eAED:-0.15 QI:0/-1/0/1/-1/1/1/0/663
MWTQPHESNNGSSRKRPHESTCADGSVQNIESIQLAREPRLTGDGRNHMMDQFFHNMNAHRVQGDTAAQHQADVATFFGRALAHAQANVPVHSHQGSGSQNSASNTFAYPNRAPFPANQAPANFSVNNTAYHNQVQNASTAPFAPQPQQVAMQVQPPHSASMLPGHLRPFGMAPQELLNYAVIVNILHNSIARGNGNAVSTLVANRPQGGNQEPANQAGQPPPRGFMNCAHGVASDAVQAAASAAPPPQEYNQTMPSSTLTFRQTNAEKRETQFPSLPYDHTVSPSIPSENNFNTRSVALPSHVVQTQHIDPKIRCVPLWTNEDESRLSLQQCWLRKQIETFPASQRDVRRHTRGRNRILELGQVGIQCIHCKNLPQEGRGKGSSYFPSSTKGIYQAAQNILAYHFKEDTCPIITQQLLQEMRDAGSCGSIPRHLTPKAGKSRSGGGKSFWEFSAIRTTGLVDTTVGIRYSNDCQNYRPLESVTLGMTETGQSGTHYCSSESVLVCREDKDVVTDFCFLLMSQFVPYADDSRKSMSEYSDVDSDLDEDEARRFGIVCRFCKGVSHDGKHRDGVFLSINPSTLMRNKQLTKLHGHLVSCRYAPGDLKMNVINAKEIHLPQSDRLKRGWKKVFFENVSLRLKEALDAKRDVNASSEALSGATYDV